MKKIYLLCIFIISLIIFNVSNVYAQKPQVLPGCSYILIDSKTGQVIAEHNADQKHRPASTTKIMTAIVALENGQLDSEMKVSLEAVYDIGPGGMNIGIMQGENNLTLENLLNVMLIKSANEAANIIAENVSATRADFIEKMNSKAVEIGALNTHFVNPCGKDDLKEEANHLSTARDMATIARYAMTIPKFREIVSKEYYNDMPATNKHDKWDILRTTNKLLWDSNKYDYVLDGQKKQYTVTGIKTGFTSAAGFNLVCSAVDENGMELIAAILHVTEGNNKINAYAKEIFKYGFENYSNQKIVDSNQFIKSVEVQDAKDNKKLDLVTGSELICAMPLDKNNNGFESKEYINPTIKAPVKKGDVLGYVEYNRNGVLLGKVDLVASQDVEANQKETIIKETVKSGSNKLSVTNVVFILFSVAASFVLIRMFLKRLSKKLKDRRYNKY
jgi:D-alanyl-D-alanine carboxypeptidase/D-alanyl-D-alanine carboxypeptidase (penicillin-binding protein 5/6)